MENVISPNFSVDGLLKRCLGRIRVGVFEAIGGADFVAALRKYSGSVRLGSNPFEFSSQRGCDVRDTFGIHIGETFQRMLKAIARAKGYPTHGCLAKHVMASAVKPCSEHQRRVQG